MKNGIDVSYYQKNIDWQKVKGSGIDFVIIRIGYSGYAGEIHKDKSFKLHIEGAIAAGLDVGVYVYAYNTSTESARKTAHDIVDIIKPYKLTYPIALDVEETKDKCLTAQGKEGLTSTIIAFIEELNILGYLGIWYTYTYFAKDNLNTDRLAPYEAWIADYRKTCGYIGGYGIWQYIGGDGNCDGVEGPCDRNYSYKDYPSIIKTQGLNGFDKTSEEVDYKALYYSILTEIRDLQKKYNI